MQTKQAIQDTYLEGKLFCAECFSDLTPDTSWLPDDTHDSRVFCNECATAYSVGDNDAIRVKDLL